MTDWQKDKINNLIPLLEFGIKIGKDTDILYEFVRTMYKQGLLSNDVQDFVKAKISDVVYEIEESIDKLKIGESTIIPGGFEGHAILYQIHRIRENSYEFSIFNTGLGREFGQGKYYDPQNEKQFNVPIFTNLSKEAVLDHSFLTDLIIQSIKIYGYPNNVYFGPYNTHQKILDHLTKKHPGIQSIREPHDAQTWGTCTFDCVAAFLEYELPPSIFAPFQYDMMLRARGLLNALLPTAKTSGIFSNNAIDFIDKKSCETIAEWTKRFKEFCKEDPKDEDLKFARKINELGVRNVTDFKEILQKQIDYSFRLEKDIGFYDKAAFVGNKAIDATSKLGVFFADFVMPFLSGFYGFPYNAATNPSLLIPNAFYLLKEGLGIEVLNDKQIKDCFTEVENLRKIQNIIEKISPEEIKVLTSRREFVSAQCISIFSDLFSSFPTNRANIFGLNLENVFNHLKNRYAEIALCLPNLLNATHSPLKEAIAACPGI